MIGVGISHRKIRSTRPTWPVRILWLGLPPREGFVDPNFSNLELRRQRHQGRQGVGTAGAES